MKKKLSIEDFKKWGSKGGKTKSKAKAEAVRENGKLGGRPKKKKVKEK